MSKKAAAANNVEDKKEDLQEEMQVLDEVHDGDDAAGYVDEEIEGEGEEHADEETEYLEGEEDLAEEDIGEEIGEEELGEEELQEEFTEEGEPAEEGDGEGEGEGEGEKTAEGDEKGEGDEKAESKDKKEDAAKSAEKDGEEELVACPYGHTLRDDTHTNRYGCTPEECHRKDDPAIADSKRPARDGEREHRERLFLPNYKSLKIDMKVAARIRSVVAGPLEMDDMQKDEVQDILKQTEECIMRFKKGEDEKYSGHVQFRFPTYEEAAESVEKIEKVKEGLTVKQTVGLNIGAADKLIRPNDDDIEIPADTVKTLVSVCGIPPTTTKEQILELFPQAKMKLMAMKANGTLKGYAYIELDDEEGAKKLVEEHLAKPHVVDGHKLYLEKMQANFEAFMVIDSDDVLTDEERAKIVRTLNISQMQLDRRGTRMKAKEYHDLVRKVKMMKQKLAMDNRKRREKGMAIPKPPMRRGGARPISSTPYTSRGRGLGPRASVRDTRPRREGLSPRSSVRSPVSRRPAPRADDSYHSRSPRGESYYGPPSSRREMGPPRRSDSERGRFSTSDRGSSRYSGSSDRGRSGKLNTHQTANAVNMLVGLTSLLSEMQRKPVAGSTERRESTSRAPASSSSTERWAGSSYSDRSRPRSGEYSSSYGSSSTGFRESSSSYRDEWGSSRAETMRSGRETRGGHSSYDDSYYEDRTRKRTMSDRGYDDEYYSRSDRGAPKRSKMVSRGRGGGRGRY